MFGRMINFTPSAKQQGERKVHRARPEDFVRFKSTGEPSRWPSRRK